MWLRPPSPPIRPCRSVWGTFSLIPLSLIRSCCCSWIHCLHSPFGFPSLPCSRIGASWDWESLEGANHPIPVILKFVQPAHPYSSFLPGFLPPHQWSLGLSFLWIFHSSLSLFAPPHSLLVPPYIYPVASFDLGLLVAVRSP